jgi:2-oxoglutarate ferredoxin oxidoreductase subunit alpha
MVVLGALAKLIDWPGSYMDDFVTDRFTRGRAEDEEIIKSNHQALGLGRDEAVKITFKLGELSDPIPCEGEQILIRGNDAVSMGALTAGVEFYVGYPISPATPILVSMERNLVGPGKFAYQASSEIESIAAILGAGFAGKKSMTATSGPGLSLMSEGIGLGWMAEIPAVIVNVQRGGPATGLPTKTEQSDLLMALTPAHGDCRIPIIAPGTVAECFEGTVKAFNWAERYQGPVILLSEMMLAERAQNIPRPDVEGTVVENRTVYRGENGYRRFEAAEVSPMPIPGGPGAYVANASEHDSIGDTTHLPQRHILMTERRFSKLKLLEDGTYESDNADQRVAIMPWGGSKGPAREAYDQLVDEGEKLAWFYTIFLHPLPPALLEELRSKDLVIVPELNFQGQFSSILRMDGVKAESITQYTGLPFKVSDLMKRVREHISVAAKESVTA